MPKAKPTAEEVAELERVAKFLVAKVAKNESPQDPGGIAEDLKEHFDGLYMEPWHCFIGRKFAFRVTYEPGHFLYLHMGNQTVLLYKTPDSEETD